jgi:TMEM175 potassium channel family protein
MTRGRMEAFSDGVIAILITIMVLELKVPQGKDLAALRPLGPVLLSYVLSFVYLGIYWNNHHHLLHAVRHVDGRVLWANLHLLFWLSLLPFVTHWTGETGFAAVPVAAYGGVLLLAGVAYWLLVRALIARQGRDSLLASAIGSDFKGNVSILAYLAAIPLAFVERHAANAVYVAVAILWLVPDRRIERALAERGE